MKVTSEFLNRCDASEEAIKFIEQNFSEGAEPLEIIEKFPDLPRGWLYFARDYFLQSEKEIAKFNELCKIKDCGVVANSYDVENGDNIVDSEVVRDSTYIFHSNTVNDSHFIYNSHNIVLSNNINGSEDIYSSSIVVHSEGVHDSVEICDSDYINWSRNILLCNNINDSQFVYHSNNLADCYFCGFVQNCNHCMFCSGIEDRSYYIFNKPVDIKTFEALKQILLLNLDDEHSTFIALDGDEILNGNKRFIFNLRYDSVFNGLSDGFFGWVGTLPNYSDEKFLNLFFKERKFENS